MYIYTVCIYINCEWFVALDYFTGWFVFLRLVVFCFLFFYCFSDFHFPLLCNYIDFSLRDGGWRGEGRGEILRGGEETLCEVFVAFVLRALIGRSPEWVANVCGELLTDVWEVLFFLFCSVCFAFGGERARAQSLPVSAAHQLKLFWQQPVFQQHRAIGFNWWGLDLLFVDNLGEGRGRGGVSYLYTDWPLNVCAMFANTAVDLNNAAWWSSGYCMRLTTKKGQGFNALFLTVLGGGGSSPASLGSGSVC